MQAILFVINQTLQAFKAFFFKIYKILITNKLKNKHLAQLQKYYKTIFLHVLDSDGDTADRSEFKAMSFQICDTCVHFVPIYNIIINLHHN
jgi:predicted choloylglycine hydrolase